MNYVIIYRYVNTGKGKRSYIAKLSLIFHFYISTLFLDLKKLKIKDIIEI
mgnify:CR=1 FL=1